MAEVKKGNKVKVHYKGTLDDGNVFDSSEGRKPLEFKVGEKKLIPGFDNMVLGMKVGDKKKETIGFDNAYGPRNPQLVMTVGRDRLPKEVEPKVGDMFKGQRPDGMVLAFTVIDVTDENVTLDANHPLAGKDLTFEITIVEIA